MEEKNAKIFHCAGSCVPNPGLGGKNENEKNIQG